MATRVLESRELVSQEVIQFIRSQIISLTLTEARPNAKMNVFFGDENVTYLCSLSGNERGTDIITDDNGQASIDFFIPSGEFNVGTYDIIVTDAPNLESLQTLGSVFGSARGAFSASGRIDIFQTTRTTVTTVVRERPVRNRDPLAQSFFTFGVEGGIFLSSIDIFFQTKDESVPVRCELRRLENGYPSPIEPNKPELISVLNASEIETSNDASVASKFVFNPPVYLKEESEYCFVLKTNSNSYNIFTSVMGETSFEDGRTIFKQPYVGSLFKSENDITWTAEQFEDIKFRINKASFDTSTAGRVELAAEVPPLAASGERFETVSGSNIVTYTHKQDHGLEPGSKFRVWGQVSVSGGSNNVISYNGIPQNEFANKLHTVISTPNRKTLTFSVDTPASSSGKILSSNVVTKIAVNSSGINYSPSDIVNITGGGGAGASAVLNVVNGQIKSVTITNGGFGYTSAPTVTVISANGTGATFTATVLPMFSVEANKPMTAFVPKIDIFNYGTTRTENAMSTTIGNYEGGNLVTYTPGQEFQIIPNFPYLDIDQNSLIASEINENEMMSGTKSAKLSIDLISDNTNLSPVIDMSISPRLRAYYTLINAQPGETLNAANSTGFIDNIEITSPGSNYTLEPIITIDPPDLEEGVQATATAIINNGEVTDVTITEAGSGYTSIPLIVVTPQEDDTSGSGAALKANLSPFNTELLPQGGSAKARYITKKNTLQIVSSGVRLFCVLSSIEGSYVDWYIRTSLTGSGVDHETKSWRRLDCDVERNRSSFSGEFIEYEFKLDDIPEFDVYDLKCVMGAQDPTKAPIVKSYRVIVVA